MPVESLMNLPLKDIVQDLRSLEPFPSVATRVLELASDEEVVPSELIEMSDTPFGYAPVFVTVSLAMIVLVATSTHSVRIVGSS